MSKTGPKPMSPEAYAAKYANKLQYTLIKVLEERRFLVTCNLCGATREVGVTGGNMGRPCHCTHKRKFYLHKRTLKTHNQELVERKPGYKCLLLPSLPKTKKGVYKHLECGKEFKSSMDNLWGSKVPCPICRPVPNLKSHEQFISDIQGSNGHLIILDRYKSCVDKVRVLYPECLCIEEFLPEQLLRVKRYCPRCQPRMCGWQVVDVKGYSFKVRSKPEAEFIKHMVYRGINPSKIIYEPKDSRVRYRGENGEWRRYTPDFRVGKIVIEVKDLGSLGITHYRFGDQETILEGNRRKVLAARKQFEDFRVYVLTRQGIYRTYDFWTLKEQRRLLSL